MTVLILLGAMAVGVLLFAFALGQAAALGDQLVEETAGDA